MSSEKEEMTNNKQRERSRDLRRDIKVLFAELGDVLGADPGGTRKDVLKRAIQDLKAQGALLEKLTTEKNEERPPCTLRNTNVGTNVDGVTTTPLSTALAIIQSQCLHIQRLEAELIRCHHVNQLLSLQHGVGFSATGPALPSAHTVSAVSGLRGRGSKRKMSRSQSSSHQGSPAGKHNSRSTKRKRNLSSRRRTRAASPSSSGEETTSLRCGTTSLGTFSFD